MSEYIWLIFFILLCIGFIFLLSLNITILLHEHKKKKHENDDWGWKKYDTINSTYIFEYWHGDQDGTLYRVINDRHREIIKNHISIETADMIIDQYIKSLN